MAEHRGRSFERSSPVSELQDRLQSRSRHRRKVWWEKYVRDSAPFRGTPTPVVRTLLHRWYRERHIGKLSASRQLALALRLIRCRYTEDKLAGALLLQEILLPGGMVRWRRDLPRFADLFDRGAIADWNTCDWFCVKVLGPMIQREGPACARAIAAWRKADTLWRARASVVPFVTVSRDRRYDPLVRQNCRALIRREERFAKTAVGWMLRSISRQNRTLVVAFIGENLRWFSPESLSNATRYFPASERRRYLDCLRDISSPPFTGGGGRTHRPL